MQTYPSINKITTSHKVFIFDKIDGSNIRAEWTKKNGFAKFGSRTRLLESQERPLGEAIEIFQEKYQDILHERFTKERFVKATVFFEFYGANSFAGYHAEEPHDLSFFDIHEHKKGIIHPKEFLRIMEDFVPTPNLIAYDKVTTDFIQAVKDNDIEGMTFEGVVCKGGLDKHKNLSMFKIKSHDWLEKLKAKCGNDENLFKQLA